MDDVVIVEALCDHLPSHRANTWDVALHVVPNTQDMLHLISCSFRSHKFKIILPYH